MTGWGQLAGEGQRNPKEENECSPPATGGKVDCGPGYFLDKRCDGATVRRCGATVREQNRVSGSRI